MKTKISTLILVLLLSLSGSLFSQVVVNDEYFYNQWYLNMPGNDNTRADIRVLDAWSRTLGSNSQKIADIEDSPGGIPFHTDLSRITTQGGGIVGEHATNIAGILIANHNTIGIAGLNKFAQLYSYVYDDFDQWADKIRDARLDGNQIINISQGSYESMRGVAFRLMEAHNSNIITVISAGNNNSSITKPGSFAGVITVGASTKGNTSATWSNYGSKLNYLAPGGSTLLDPTNNQNIYTTSSNGSYKYASGTSMAAPIVSGAASLLLAYKPDLTNEDVKNILRYSCDKLVEMGTNDFTTKCGYGRINLKKAMQYLEAPYTMYHGNAILTKLYDNIGMAFTNDPFLPFGIYYGDAYKLSVDRDDLRYSEIPRAWLPCGYSPYFPNNSQEFLNSTITTTSFHAYAFFYYIEHDEVGNQINMWVPYNPSLTYTILGKPLFAPVISNLVQNPTPVCRNATTRITSTLSQGNGTLTYNWTLNDVPAGSQIYPHGSYCDIFIGPLADNIDVLPATSVTLNISNDAGESILNRTVFVNNGCSGCPTLAFEENGNLVDENTLLVTSISNPDKDVTDYYLINTPLAPINNKINLTIHEPQTEHTWFDNFSLLETRANPDETIVVNDEGQVINYKGILPARIMLNGNIDVTENLLSMDSVVVKLYPGDEISITRNATEGDGDVVLGGEEPPVAKDRPALLLNVLKESKLTGEDERTVIEKVPITNFYFRPNRSIISKKLRNLPTGTIQIAVNKELTLDYFVFVTDLRTARTRTLPLVSAVHNVNGDIKSKVTGIDQNYAEMYPTERIDLSFSTTTNSGNRAYILKTVGRYETDTTFASKPGNLAKINEQPIVPTENRLYDNYPNPFNPNTIIKYSLKDDGKVSLKIFNSLGEEVRTLVNEIKSSGNYEVEFNASNLPSGVYIYQLTTQGFTQARKMVLAK